MSAASSPLDPDAPLRLAYLTYRGKPHVGGQGVYTRHLTKALVDLGHHVEVFGGQPYPVLDERIELTKLPSLDTFNDHFPGRLPGYWEIKDRYDLLEFAEFITGTFPEPRAFSARAAAQLVPRAGEFDLVHDNQCLGKGILKIEEKIPTIVTLHHPITKDRELEMSHARTRYKRWSVGRWYSFVKMQGKVASKLPRIVVVSQNSIDDIHNDMGVSKDRMRLVPVGVDPDLFRPLPDVARQPGRLITTASADVALKGLSYLLEAMAKLRTERDVTLTIIGKPKLLVGKFFQPVIARGRAHLLADREKQHGVNIKRRRLKAGQEGQPSAERKRSPPDSAEFFGFSACLNRENLQEVFFGQHPKTDEHLPWESFSVGDERLSLDEGMGVDAAQLQQKLPERMKILRERHPDRARLVTGPADLATPLPEDPVAVILGKIQQGHAAKVLATLPENFAMEVIMRMLQYLLY